VRTACLKKFCSRVFSGFWPDFADLKNTDVPNSAQISRSKYKPKNSTPKNRRAQNRSDFKETLEFEKMFQLSPAYGQIQE